MGWSPLIRVGCPRVERHERRLEPEAHYEQGDAGEQHRVVAWHGYLVCEHRCNATKVGLTRRAVHQGDAVEQEGRCKPTEDEVLEAGLLACCATPIACRQHIQREAENLDAEECRKQIVGAHHYRGAQGGREHESVGLE